MGSKAADVLVLPSADQLMSATESQSIQGERRNTTKQPRHALISVQCAYRYDRGQLCTGGVVWASGVRAYSIPSKCPHYGCPLSSRQAQIVIMV